MKKVLAILLSTLLLFTALPLGAVSVSAATSGTTGSCTWTLNGTHLTISGYGAMADYVERRENFTIVNSTPWDRNIITSVTIGDGATTVGEYAFYGCTSLTSVTIGDSVTSIGEAAFYGCTSLTTVTIGDSVTSIGDWAFYYCDSLTSVTIGDSVVTIGGSVFQNCTALATVTIGDSVTAIGEYAFSGCYSLTALTLPDSLLTIGDRAFLWCGLSEINIPAGTAFNLDAFDGCYAAINVDESHRWYSSVDGVLFNKDKTVLYRCPFGRYEIPDGVTTISSNAFGDVSFVVIPDTVTAIYEYAFSYAYDLTVYYTGSEADRANIYIADWGNEELLNATWYYGESDAADAAVGLEYRIDGGCVTITGYTEELPANLVIPSAIEGYPVTTIAVQAFYNCENLTILTIPDSVTAIGYGAFQLCENLVKATIGDGVTALPSSVFSCCWSLCMVEMGNHITSIGDMAFESCPLYSITLPAGVSHIGYDAFGGYGAHVGAIHVQPGNPYFASVDGVLFNSDKTTLLRYPDGKWGAYTIPDSVTTIGYRAFGYCRGLTSVTIPGGIATIGYCAFDSCDSLKSVIIPNSVTAIEQWAFNCCDNLTDVYYGGTEEDRDNISIDSSNRELLNATWHYYCDGHVYDGICDPDCNKCGEEREDLGHTYDGVCDPDCNECGAVRDVPDHWYELVYDCDPTCGMEGFAEYICVYCGHFYADITPATGNHTYDHECDRDCNTCGFTREVGDHFYDTACDPDCIFCGFIREVPDHVYDDEYDADCNVCGEIREVPEKPILYGDANGDGAVNARDAALLQQYVAGWDVTMDEESADANGDGAVNARDAALLQQYVAGWDVMLD